MWGKKKERLQTCAQFNPAEQGRCHYNRGRLLPDVVSSKTMIKKDDDNEREKTKKVASKLGVTKKKKTVTTKIRRKQMKEAEEANNGKGRRGEGSRNEVRQRKEWGSTQQKLA